MRVGIDLIEIARVARALERHPRFAERVFTQTERDYCLSRANPAQHFAARFAGKEAVLSGRTAAWAERVRAGAIDLSMTHSKGMAAAVAVVDEA